MNFEEIENLLIEAVTTHSKGLPQFMQEKPVNVNFGSNTRSLIEYFALHLSRQAFKENLEAQLVYDRRYKEGVLDGIKMAIEEIEAQLENEEGPRVKELGLEIAEHELEMLQTRVRKAGVVISPDSAMRNQDLADSIRRAIRRA